MQVPVGVTHLDAEYLSRHQPVGKTDQYINLREISKRFLLPPGDYCVVPTAFSPGEEGQFLVRIFVEKYWGRSQQGDDVQRKTSVDDEPGLRLSPINIPIHVEGLVYPTWIRKRFLFIFFPCIIHLFSETDCLAITSLKLSRVKVSSILYLSYILNNNKLFF